jgi:hypothetical protein
VAIPDVLRNDASKPFHARVGDVAVQIAIGKGFGTGKIKDIKPISALVRERKEHYQASSQKGWKTASGIPINRYNVLFASLKRRSRSGFAGLNL